MTYTENEISQIVHEYYNLKTEVTALHGYDEENFLLKAAGGKKFIVKVAGQNHPAEVVEAPMAMLDHLAHTTLANRFQKVLKNTSGDSLTFLTKNNQKSALRILTFLEGAFWHETKNHTELQYQNLGNFLGQMDASLQDFTHFGLHRQLSWDVSNAADAIQKTKFINDPAQRRLASYFLLQFEMEVAPLLSSLRHAYIHNDANDHNVLIKGNEISGLIDFGDAVYSALINNLAIACTYAILEADDPLTAAVAVTSGYHKAYPLTEQETDLLYYLIAARLCISVTQSAYNASRSSNNEHHFLTEKPAWNLLAKWIQINPLKAQQSYRLACGFASIIDESDEYKTLLEERKGLIGRNLSISYKKPIKIVKGALQYLYDDKGNTFVDCVNNVSHVGHCHPTVVRAMQKQIATLNTNTRYLNDSLVEFAKAITAKLPSKLQTCYFVNSGSEANDLAIRMSRYFTGAQDIIVLDHAYHGTSTTALEMSPYKFDGRGGFSQKPYIHKAVSPDLYRGEFQYSDENAGEKYAVDVQRITENLQKQQKKPAAFICETLLGVGGQIPLPKNYLKEVYKYVRAAGGVCIADEVQVGFGRVGKTFWGFELQEVEPDIVVLGKPIGNGHPLAAVVVTNEIADKFNNGMEYFNTFGGNPVSMVAGLAVLDVIKGERLQENALETGNYLLQMLNGLRGEYEIIGDVRGHGLFLGVELVKSRITKQPAVAEINEVIEKMKMKGFLLSTDGPLNNVIKIKPPLVFNKKNAEELVQALDDILAKYR